MAMHECPCPVLLTLRDLVASPQPPLPLRPGMNWLTQLPFGCNPEVLPEVVPVCGTCQ